MQPSSSVYRTSYARTGLDPRVGRKRSRRFWTKPSRESGLTSASAPMKPLLILLSVLFIAPPVDAQTQLRFVTWKSEAAKIWERVIADFEARHPGVKVVQEVGPQSSTEFHDLVTQKLRNRDAQMDVFFMDVIWPAEFAAASWALPLDAFFSVAERNLFLDAPIQANTYDGRIYGVPMFVD